MFDPNDPLRHEETMHLYCTFLMPEDCDDGERRWAIELIHENGRRTVDATFDTEAEAEAVLDYEKFGVDGKERHARVVEIIVRHYGSTVEYEYAEGDAE